MWPDLPTSHSGAYVIEPGEAGIDQECQARFMTRYGKPFGCWLDDTTFNAAHDLDYYVSLAVAKYAPLKQPVFVCVPPGEPTLRHRPTPPVVNVYERYIYGMGVSPSAWGACPAYPAYCIQWNWPGTVGKQPPTQTQRDVLLAEVAAHHPKFLFLF